MTVKELISILQTFDEDYEVIVTYEGYEFTNFKPRIIYDKPHAYTPSRYQDKKIVYIGP